MKGEKGMIRINLLRKGVSRMDRIKEELRFTLMMLAILMGIYGLTGIIHLSTETKLLLGFIVMILLTLFMGSLAIAARKRITGEEDRRTKEEESEEEAEEGAQLLGGLIRNVPANMIWVLRRSLFGSNVDAPGGPKGYSGRKEGWRFKIPFWHEDLGLVDLSPQTEDPESIVVNTSDNQTAIVDWRKVTYIPNETSAIKFAVKVNGQRKKFEMQQAAVALNQICSQETQEQLSKIDPGELQEKGENATKLFNVQMGKLDIGIKARVLEIKKILMPEEIRAVAEYETVTQKRRNVAIVKGAELNEIISATQADPTKVVLTDMARDALTNLVDIVVNAFRAYQETSQKGGT